MNKSLYLINPKADAPSYYGAESVAAHGLQPAVNIADLTLPTVAALAPASFKVQLCDESVTAVDLASQADFIGITGKSTQVTGMLRLARHFRQQGKTVIFGGPFATLSPEAVRADCDILVRGEIELIASDLFADLQRGRWQAEYVGGQPDLSHSPIPRWDLYPNDRALLATIQTSRGCPFECEFCDVIQYVGRRQRHKPIDQVLTELEVLADLGYRSVFLADDNLTVHRRRAKELLTALAEWNARRSDGPFHFVSQVSIDTGREDDILSLAAAAGLREVFIGIETPNEESLREVHKRQNVGVNLQAQIQRFLHHGISVTGGMMVGFDADGPDIFERQRDFAMSTPIPIFTTSVLVAPNATPLYSRLEQAGRLTSGAQGADMNVWQTNIIPARMTQAELLEGTRWLVNEIYRPEAFGKRVLTMIESLGQPDSLPSAPRQRTLRPVEADSLTLLLRLQQLGRAEAAMVSTVTRMAAKKPLASAAVMNALFRYAQIRYMLQQANLLDRPV
jgi:radical SAM superfamily enzyme YgiQ (UPF0313 family)